MSSANTSSRLTVSADSLPGLTIEAEEAARRILDAARRGDAEVGFPAITRLAAIAGAVAPGLTAATLELTARLLPAPPPGRDERRPGRESQSAASPSWLTRLGDKAARRYNQIAPTEGASA